MCNSVVRVSATFDVLNASPILTFLRDVGRLADVAPDMSPLEIQSALREAFDALAHRIEATAPS